MLKSSGNIYMDYRAMKQKADELDDLAKELESIIEDEISDCMNSSRKWKGDSGEAFRQKVTKLENKLNKRAKDMHRMANGIRQAAERQYKLERMLVALVSK